ncbi:unnamed protein product [Heterobilharzia americana]|nr:unnamed protein product [Heterobilharzia americana]
MQYNQLRVINAFRANNANKLGELRERNNQMKRFSHQLNRSNSFVLLNSIPIDILKSNQDPVLLQSQPEVYFKYNNNNNHDGDDDDDDDDEKDEEDRQTDSVVGVTEKTTL